MFAKELYEKALALTDSMNREDRAFDLSCILQKVCQRDRFSLSVISEKEADTFFTFVKRYANGEPLQYILGEWEFYGLPFYVGPGVLIPQPDTETLVEAALAYLQGISSPCVADLCAGSGCVAAAIAHARPDARIFALELSPEAFSYMQRNFARNQVQITAFLTDVFSPPESLPMLDLIVSNPPYLTTRELMDVSVQVSWEPRMALDGGGDGLIFYRGLPPLYLPYLKEGGHMAFEVGYTQAEDVKTLFTQCGLFDIKAHLDLSGVKRVISAAKPSSRIKAI